MSASGGVARVFERGAAAVETALLTPLLATLLIGAIEVGAAFNHSLDMEGAARDAARHASEHPDRTRAEIIARAEAAVDSSAPVTVTITPDVEKPCEGREGDTVEVVVSTIETLDLLFVQTATVTVSGNGTYVCLTQ
jgi:Flp pilus assembly protein TadG